jgi:hypothetical protein
MTSVTIKSKIFWGLTPCSVMKTTGGFEKSTALSLWLKNKPSQ